MLRPKLRICLLLFLFSWVESYHTALLLYLPNDLKLSDDPCVARLLPKQET